MEKKIEDYLHLYLGCECQVDDDKIGINYGVTRRVPVLGKINPSDIIRHTTVKVVYDIMKKHGFETIPFPSVKIILRPLSDMTEEEAKEVNVEGAKGWRRINNGINDDIYLGLIHRQANEVKYLISKSFDVFGLIKAGLAIDRTTLKTNN